MLKIRLQRTGRKNEQHFRVVVTEHTTSPRGKAVEVLGFLNPRQKVKGLNKDRVLYWMGKGAKASDTMTNWLISEKIIEGKKIPVHKQPKKKDEKK